MERRNRALFCDKCSLQFDKKIVYDMHLSIIHKTKVKNSSEFWEGNQSLMLKSDNTKSNMNNLSLNLIHKETKSHEYSTSDNTTSQKKPLKKQVETNNIGSKNQHKCLICDYTFSQKWHLKQHIASVHEGKKPHECSICDYTSSKKANLEKHIKSVHQGKKPHKCSICDYTSSKKQI